MATETDAAEVVHRTGELLRNRLTGVVQVAEADQQPAVDHAFNACLSTLAGTGIWGEANRLLSSLLWNLASEFLETGWLQARARHKPRGYAGDHELLRRIAEQEICKHPLGRYFDQYFQAQAAPQAVRNRIALAAEWIENAAATCHPRECRVAIVGSGPAQEVKLAWEHLSAAERSRLHVTLLDMDGEALDGAAIHLAQKVGKSQLTTIQGNLFRLAEKPSLAAHLHGADLILCTGLFDYLTSPVANAVLAEFWQKLAPGGAAYVFNFSPRNPTRAYMEWFGNWYLLYRTVRDLEELAEGAHIPAENRSIGAEPLGIDLYLAIQKLVA